MLKALRGPYKCYQLGTIYIAYFSAQFCPSIVDICLKTSYSYLSNIPSLS